MSEHPLSMIAKFCRSHMSGMVILSARISLFERFTTVGMVEVRCSTRYGGVEPPFVI